MTDQSLCALVDQVDEERPAVLQVGGRQHADDADDKFSPARRPSPTADGWAVIDALVMISSLETFCDVGSNFKNRRLQVHWCAASEGEWSQRLSERRGSGRKKALIGLGAQASGHAMLLSRAKRVTGEKVPHGFFCTAQAVCRLRSSWVRLDLSAAFDERLL